MVSALLSMLTVWTAPDGTPVYAATCRNQVGGCEAHVRHVAGLFEEYGALYGVDPWLLAAVSYHEARLSSKAVSKVGAFTLMQLNPRSRWGRKVQRICSRVSQRQCDRVAVREAAALLARCIKKCGDVDTGLRLYASGSCESAPRYADAVLSFAEGMDG